MANRLPLDEMIGIDYDTDSKWGVMNRGDVPDDELIVKRARIVLRGEASDFSYVTSRELGLEFFGVVLSNIRLYAGKAWNPYNNNDLPDRRYVVKEAYLPVIALTSWERAG